RGRETLEEVGDGGVGGGLGDGGDVDAELVAGGGLEGGGDGTLDDGADAERLETLEEGGHQGGGDGLRGGVDADLLGDAAEDGAHLVQLVDVLRGAGGGGADGAGAGGLAVDGGLVEDPSGRVLHHLAELGFGVGHVVLRGGGARRDHATE